MQIPSVLSSPATASTVASRPPTSPPLPAVGMSPTPFKETLEKLSAVSDDDSAARKKAEDAAAGLVSTALIMPMFRQLRRSTFNTKGPYSPGMGEKAFGPEFDMQLADRIAHSPRLGIKKALADRLMKKTNSGTMATKGLNVHG